MKCEDMKFRLVPLPLSEPLVTGVCDQKTTDRCDFPIRISRQLTPGPARNTSTCKVPTSLALPVHSSCSGRGCSGKGKVRFTLSGAEIYIISLHYCEFESNRGTGMGSPPCRVDDNEAPLRGETGEEEEVRLTPRPLAR